MTRYCAILAAILLSGCGSVPLPEALTRVVEVKTPILVPVGIPASLTERMPAFPEAVSPDDPDAVIAFTADGAAQILDYVAEADSRVQALIDLGGSSMEALP